MILSRAAAGAGATTMTTSDPLRKPHEEAEASFIPWGEGPDAPSVVECFGPVELEYGAIRRGGALFDWPQRGVLRVSGADRRDFLNRLLTQELRDQPSWSVRRSFWLNRQGRIDADLRVIETGEEALLDCDRLVAPAAAESLSRFIITEDVRVTDESAAYRRLAMHGPSAGPALDAACAAPGGPAPSALAPGLACRATIAGAGAIIDRQDSAGEPGFEVLVGADAAPAVYGALLAAGAEHRLRRAGWHAYNVARIEAGWPLYLVDFGPDSIPNETGALEDRVSFRKGCYLGQEVVARIHARGRPRRVLVALRLERRERRLGGQSATLQPVTGARVALDDAPGSEPVGAVTSSAVSPMLGDAPICFAQVKTAHAAPGATLHVEAGAELLPGVIQPGLVFWRRSP